MDQNIIRHLNKVSNDRIDKAGKIYRFFWLGRPRYNVACATYVQTISPIKKKISWLQVNGRQVKKIINKTQSIL